MSAAWTCSYQVGDVCDLLKKPCTPGDKGCTLYGKAVFADPYSPSNAAVKRRESMRDRKGCQESDDPRFH